ncbi:MAG: hypothetical protein WCS43_14535, partial [Verrucomicrobiota bacterium]
GKRRVREKIVSGENDALTQIVLDDENPPAVAVTWLRGGISPSLPGAPVFIVPLTDSSKSTDQRMAMKDRQAFIGIKTSPAK